MRPAEPLAAVAPAGPRLAAVLARVLRPRVVRTVSQWADEHRLLSSKGSAEPGRWRTARNPPLQEPMDCMSRRHPAREVVLMFPVQFGKTEVALNALGYAMCDNPGPVMVCLPGEVSLNKWVAQKLQPMLDSSPAVRETLTSQASREAANTRTFKDFEGGQLYLEHAGSPSRLKSTSVQTLIVDEVDEFAASFGSGDDPMDMLDRRTSAYPATFKRLYISTPQTRGISRIEALWERSDQRLWHVPCPHCGHEQPLEWTALHWGGPPAPGSRRQVWVACRDCGGLIDETQKTALIAAGRWIPQQPNARVRGYHINCLYYPVGLGPRWSDLVEEFLAAQGDPARQKTFVNDRLAQSWADPAMRAVRADTLADRAEPYALREAPREVLAVTAGVDTQDNRLAVQIVGWGARMSAWTLDYIELPGDPADDAVWVALVDLLGRPIDHASGQTLRVEATAIDMGGHRTEAVKHFVRQARVRRAMAIFGATANNARVLAPGKPSDVNWKGSGDKRGVLTHMVGTVAVKHFLFSRLATDAERPIEERLVHFSDQLPPEFFTGMTSEIFDPKRNRFEKRRGARNEPLDTWGYAYVAAHHPELRLHQMTVADWERRAARLSAEPAVRPAAAPAGPVAAPSGPVPRAQSLAAPRPASKAGFVKGWRK